MSTKRMTMAQALVTYLSNQYIERDGETQRLIAGMLGIFGHGNVSGLGQALEECGMDLPFIKAQNEQGMVHTATAYARARNRLQIYACTSSVGPGATNMITGAATATINRLPVLLLPGDTFASRLPHPVLQQLEHTLGQDVTVNDCFRPVSKYWDRINRPEQLLSSLPEAIRVLTDQAEMGAVTIALPEDTQTESYSYPASFFEHRIHQIRRPVAPQEALEEAVRLISGAQHPLIIAGGGVLYSDASSQVAEFSDRFGIPVVTTQAGNGALSWNHPWNAGPVGSNGGLAANRLASQADLVLAIGTRLSDFTTASRSAFQHPDIKFVSINITGLDAHKADALPLVGDAKSSIEALSALLSERSYDSDREYGDQVETLRAEWHSIVTDLTTGSSGAPLGHSQVIGIVNRSADTRDVVVCAAGSLPGDLLRLWKPGEPGTYHVEYGFSCMGYEIAGGLGVKLADRHARYSS